MPPPPNLFIVGAAKSGTTSLHNYLEFHPRIHMSPIKEPNFFSKDIDESNFTINFKKSIDFSQRSYFSSQKLERKHVAFVRNPSDYSKLFRNENQEKYFGESSTTYLYSSVAAENIYDFNPNSKIIISLRNPIERAFSHWSMDSRSGNTKSSDFVSDILEDFKITERNWGGFSRLYVDIGLYYKQVKRYFDLFPRENILVIPFGKLKINNFNLHDIILKFLGLESSKSFPPIIPRYNQSLKPKSRFLIPFIKRGKFLKHYLGKKSLKRIRRLLFAKPSNSNLDLKDVETLDSLFLDDINNLETLLDIDLKHWKRYG